MSGEIIRKGDPTSHGGVVMEGSVTDICHGKPIAYLGHKVSCPLCKGVFPIIEGVLSTTFYGKGVALAGMKTACGASLIATQFTDIVEAGGAGAPGAAPTKSAAALPALAGVAALAAAKSAKSNYKEKRVTSVSWSYGPDQTPVSGISRFYVDLNLHVQTENYDAGEMVDIALADDEGKEIIAGFKKIDVRAKVDAEGKATLMNLFAGKTVITVAEGAAA